jgi:hypothetical protein
VVFHNATLVARLVLQSILNDDDDGFRSELELL